MQISNKLALTVAKYLCRHRSVGLLRLTFDLLKDPELRETWRKYGVDPALIKPGDPLLFKAVRIVQEHVEYLQQRGAVEYIDSVVYAYGEPRELLFLPGIQVANWRGKTCGSPTPPPTSPPPENSTPTADDVAEDCRKTASAVAENCSKSAVGIADGGRKRRTLVDFL